MDLAQLLHPSPVGLALAAAAVVGGAPLFSSGLRAFRLRRQFAKLHESAVGELSSGMVHVSGRVVLEGPLFSPLSGAPCVGFRLDVESVGGPVLRSVDVQRTFRLVGSAGAARILAGSGQWEVAATSERTVEPEQPLSEALEALLARAPEALWWRRAGGRLRLVERALLADARCHVVGHARTGRAHELSAEAELLRTGTDSVVAAPAAPWTAPEVCISPGDHLDFLLVSDRAPDAALLRIPLHHTAGAVLGPAVSLLGLLYLASAADALRAVGRL